ncbi:hypothetical protein [Pontixanthobacter luteolus]|uniref:hypothetical protein n=1 Tax=Pontixanthobacter luteolus TaxID=295089 RepID=UPI002303C910|nr:hypothetical protein [Pontixanthobacter luteolus]
MDLAGGDRRDRQHERPNRRIMLVWAALSAIFIAIGLPRLLQGQFPDPDDALRLVQVRDLIAGQGWFDIHQYRIDPPTGTQMHWSRLVDIPLALLIFVLSPVLGQSGAETAALVMVPLLTLGAVLFLIGRLAWRLFDTQVAGFACLCIGLLAPLVFQLQPMRVDHHGWQIVAVAAALWAMAHRSALQGGAIAGLAMAAGLTISIEILPMVALFGAVLFIRWFRDRAARWWLVGYMQALALGLSVIFFLTRGTADLAQYCDAVSPAHLGFFIITAIGTGAIAAAPAMPRPALVAVFGLTGAAGLSFFGLASPKCLITPFASLDPLVHDYWYVHILEGRPFWEQDLSEAVPTLLQLLVAFSATLILWQKSHDWLRSWWAEYAFLIAGSIVMSLLVWRSAAFACVIAAIPLGWLATRLFRILRIEDRLLAKVGAVAATILLLLPATPVRVWDAVSALDEDTAETPAGIVRSSDCQLQQSARQLKRLENGTIFAPLDIGPVILLDTDHAVIATSHHRAEMAMRDVILAFTSDPVTAQRIIGKRGAAYVALCSDLAEPNLYAQANPGGLAAQLISGENPEWLEPVELDTPDSFRVWRVRN